MPGLNEVGGWWIRRNYDMFLTSSYSPIGTCYNYCRRSYIQLGKSWVCSVQAFFPVLALVNCSSSIFSDVLVWQYESTGLLWTWYLKIIEYMVPLFSEHDWKWLTVFYPWLNFVSHDFCLCYWYISETWNELLGCFLHDNERSFIFRAALWSEESCPDIIFP